MSNHSLPAQGTDQLFSNKSVVSTTHEQNIISSNTLICRQLFAGHVVSSRPMKRIHRMITCRFRSRPTLVLLELSSKSLVPSIDITIVI